MRRVSGAGAERALSEVARAIAAADGPGPAASDAARILAGELGLDACEISLRDGDLLRLVATAGLSAEETARLAERPVRGDRAERAFSMGTSVAGDGSWACTPIVARGHPAGVLWLQARPGVLRGTWADFLEVLGALLGAALGGPAPAGAAADRRLREIGTLAASVAHDFNNLLTTILGNARMLEEGADASAQRRLAAIIRAGKDGAQLVARLLGHARRRPPELGLVQIAQVAREALELTRPRWKDGHGAPAVRLEVDLADCPPIVADSHGLRDAFVNLIMNALDAMPGGGTLSVRTAADDGWVLAEVSDTGVGIPAAELPRIFESFYTTKGERGTGLGLTAVARAARESGGAVEVESAPGRGARFRLRFPIYAPPPLPSPQRGEGGDAASFPSPRRGEGGEGDELAVRTARGLAGIRILVVEDDADNRELLMEMLRLAGCRPEAAASVAEALGALERSVPDVVLTDLGLPETSGTAVVEAARKLPGARPAIIVLTGWGGESGKVPEADVVLQKPVANDVLLAAISRALEAV